MSNEIDRRKYPRIKIRWPITVLADKGALEGETRDITSDGIFICCKEPLRLDESFHMGIIPPDHPMIEFTGKVVWSDLYGIDDEDTAFGMGVCLVEIDEEDRKYFDGVIAGHRKS